MFIDRLDLIRLEAYERTNNRSVNRIVAEAITQTLSVSLRVQFISERKFPVMSESENSIDFGVTEVAFNVTFKIVSIDIQDEENPDCGFNLVVKFAEKCMTIAGDEAKLDSKVTRKEASREAPSSRKIQSLSSNDADDEATDASEIQKPRSRSKSKRRKGFFGSSTANFKSTPRCMAEKLSNHCIKYELMTANQQLIGWRKMPSGSMRHSTQFT